MNPTNKISILKNAIEAQRLEAQLKSEDIPHVIVSHHDSAYGTLFEQGRGYGHIEADEEHRERILALLEELRNLEEPSEPEDSSKVP